jgi:hypothetical protein
LKLIAKQNLNNTDLPESERLEAVQYCMLLIEDEHRDAIQCFMLFLNDIAQNHQVHKVCAPFSKVFLV